MTSLLAVLRPKVLSLLLLTGLGLAPASASAQVVYGRLLDSTTRDPVRFGLVQLLDPQGGLAAAATTDSTGYYVVLAPVPGVYRIAVSRLGYVPGESGLLELKPDDALEAELLLPPQPLAMEGITVEVESRPWQLRHPPSLWPYFERREFYGKLGMGRFVDREFLERWAGPIQSIPAVNLLFLTMQSRSGAMINQCSQPAWFLNGFRVWGDINEVVSVWELEGVEVYRRATEIPAEFGGSDSECGVVALWTRRGS
jgi:hypothetical protein